MMSNMFKDLRQFLTTACLFFFLMPVPGLCDEPVDLTELSIEDLMNIEVTSVSKRPQKLSATTAAVFVITSEDIRRSGVTSIPEALRMAPGLQVARIDANKWAVSSRGFNGRFANKLLVLMDGRSVYSPVFSGVSWHIQDTLLEDIDRIEVIRGPGATLWGANAVNGVINIITKHSRDTQGGLLTAGVGTEEKGFVGSRYGGRLGEDISYRAYAKYFKRDEAVFSTGDKATDDWDVLRGGFRVDRQVWRGDTLTLQGDIYDGTTRDRVTFATPSLTRTFDEKVDFKGLNLLGRSEQTLSDGSNLWLQVYYDHTENRSVISGEVRDTVDIDIKHQFLWGERHGITWGFGYRFTRDDMDTTPSARFIPDSRHDDVWSAFLQDEMSFAEQKLGLTLGSKFEYNDYSGFEIQPNVRFLWNPESPYSVWVAVSRAVRTPSRGEHDVESYINVPIPGVLPRAIGTRDFGSEELIAYEIGYRVQPLEGLLIDIASYYNDYDSLRTYEVNGFDVSPGNKMDGSTYGVELAVDWRVSDMWRLVGAYTYLQMQLHLDSDSSDVSSESAEGENPHHQASLRSSVDLPGNLELDLWARYVESLPSHDVGSYFTLDVCLGWKPFKDIELSFVGQNLLDSQHPEFLPDIVDTFPTEVERSVYGKITWKF